MNFSKKVLFILFLEYFTSENAIFRYRKRSY